MLICVVILSLFREFIIGGTDRQVDRKTSHDSNIRKVSSFFYLFFIYLPARVFEINELRPKLHSNMV